VVLLLYVSATFKEVIDNIYIYIYYIYTIYTYTAKRSTGMATIREKETRHTQTYLGGGD
jgi:hypothetical protein